MRTYILTTNSQQVTSQEKNNLILVIFVSFLSSFQQFWTNYNFQCALLTNLIKVKNANSITVG